MTGGNVRSWSYARGSPLVTMPWIQRANSAMSPVSPLVGSSATRIAMAARTVTARRSRSRVVQALAAADAVIGSGRRAHPVPLGVARHADELARRRRVRADAVGHRLRAPEQPVDLALVQRDAADLALDLVGDVRVLGAQQDTLGQPAPDLVAQVAELAEVVPPCVREVLVELDGTDEVRPRHDPAPCFVQQRDPD